MAKEEEYKELFLSEAQEGYEELNTLFMRLEQDIHNKSAIDAIFRITHTLKGNAMGLGFDAIAELSHVMEDIFNAVKKQEIKLQQELFSSLFRANDILGALIGAVKSGENVRHKGITTKLKVALRKAKSYGVEGKEQLSKTKEKERQEGIVEVEENLEVEDALDEAELEHKVVLSDMVQVPVRKLDTLLNMVGELIIEKDRLLSLNAERGHSNSDIARLDRITSDMQYQVMDVRLVQVGFLFHKFHRVLRDAAVIEKKKVRLELEGTESEIDRNILKIISDSLVHLVRNSVGHGIELPAERLKKGKDEIGTVTLRASNEKDTVIIEIEDDGAGVDVNRIKQKAIEKGLLSKEFANSISEQEAISFIFEAGFSNADEINEISGRGVGLDAVRSSVESMGGEISIQTTLGKGTIFRLALPSSMAVKGALLFLLDKQEFAIPLSYTEAVIAIRKSEIHKISNGLISKYLGKVISVVFLKDLYQMNSLEEVSKEGSLHKSFDALKDNTKLDVVIVSYSNRFVGLVVDQLTQQKEIFEKRLANPLSHIELFSGATILGNGNVCLVLDVMRIISKLFKEQMAAKKRYK